jgi:hypothetical protein
MHQFFPACRLCVNMTGIRSSLDFHGTGLAQHCELWRALLDEAEGAFHHGTAMGLSMKPDAPKIVAADKIGIWVTNTQNDADGQPKWATDLA